ncbi:hypothetical protein [Flavobacterium urocaniciphilum]|uniref:Uncharacterized protein n=1 Tax=Flavobacterium urocaniciphilum TaxID=1299341 RepID=A0A1H9CW99_9FLAO|nr:hypothetical protein [Flavobacterium urocaniciphilum]SEQ05419.1 hypothetical protein SAMN05444005_105117 [Flavobacterium urocaniciphilum]
MDGLIINVAILFIFAIYIYKISYYYDYRYIGNVIRFVVFYLIISSIVDYLLCFTFDETYNTTTIFFLIIFSICLITTLLYRSFLVNKFGTEERFASSEEIEDIGTNNDE